VDLRERLAKHRAEEQRLNWEGTFLAYFDLVKKNPQISDLAHARVHKMIMAAGTAESERGQKLYNFFTGEIFGMERSLEQLVEYFSSAAKRLEVRKRILLLMGPVGGGKSTLVALLKRGLERYARTEEGAIYAIKGCPMHEEPLHLIPVDLRAEIQKEYGIYIEGDLCPFCQQMLRDQYGGRIEEVPVCRMAFSEKNRIGIGTFTPSDPKSQDISELTGSVDLSTIGQYGSESDPRAYRFDGELNVANRGLMEFIEMLKCDEKFLYGLLTLSQEQNIKTGRFAMIYADEVIISHTNENEYNAFVNNKKNEALKDRMILIKRTGLQPVGRGITIQCNPGSSGGARRKPGSAS
jgi:serine protein kinase